MSFDDLAKRFSGVRTLFDRLSNSLDSSKLAMQGRGVPPSHSLVFEIGECHRAFTRLRADLIRRAESLSLEVPPLERLSDLTELTPFLARCQQETSVKVATSHAPPAISSATKVEPVFHSAVFQEPDVRSESISSVGNEAVEPVLHETMPAPHQEVTIPEPEPNSLVPSNEAVTHHPHLEPVTAELEWHATSSPTEHLRVSALHVLDQVAVLRLKEPGEFAPLMSAQQLARSLRETISNAEGNELPVEAQQLADGEHPFFSLLIVVAGVGDLSDAQWANHHAQISESFGRPIAVAAARGRLAGPG